MLDKLQAISKCCVRLLLRFGNMTSAYAEDATIVEETEVNRRERVLTTLVHGEPDPVQIAEMGIDTTILEEIVARRFEYGRDFSFWNGLR